MDRGKKIATVHNQGTPTDSPKLGYGAMKSKGIISDSITDCTKILKSDGNHVVTVSKVNSLNLTCKGAVISPWPTVRIDMEKNFFWIGR